MLTRALRFYNTGQQSPWKTTCVVDVELKDSICCVLSVTIQLYEAFLQSRLRENAVWREAQF